MEFHKSIFFKEIKAPLNHRDHYDGAVTLYFPTSVLVLFSSFILVLFCFLFFCFVLFRLWSWAKWTEPGADTTKMCLLPVLTFATPLRQGMTPPVWNSLWERHGYGACDQTCKWALAQEKMVGKGEAAGALGWPSCSWVPASSTPPPSILKVKSGSGGRLSFSSGVPAKLLGAGTGWGRWGMRREGDSLCLVESKKKKKLFKGWGHIRDLTVARSSLFSFWIFSKLRSGGER